MEQTEKNEKIQEKEKPGYQTVLKKLPEKNYSTVKLKTESLDQKTYFKLPIWGAESGSVNFCRYGSGLG
jgi:hypothetical protein